MGLVVFNKIIALLQQYDISYEHLQHDYVHTSEDAAKVRNTKIEQAAKAIILQERKTKQLYLFILAGNTRINLKTVKQILQVKNISLAPKEIVLEKTTCTIGSVPPFGNLFNISTYIDEQLVQTQQELVFSAGTHYDSIKMKTKDFLTIVQPIVWPYASSNTKT